MLGGPLNVVGVGWEGWGEAASGGEQRSAKVAGGTHAPIFPGPLPATVVIVYSTWRPAVHAMHDSRS